MTLLDAAKLVILHPACTFGECGCVLADRHEKAIDALKTAVASTQEVAGHMRTVREHAGSYFFDCSCGFTSNGFLTQTDARSELCPVASLLASSRERRQWLDESQKRSA
jgi:hypothetical protein